MARTPPAIKLPPPTLSDRIVSWFSPSAGLRRARDRAMMALAGAYTGASKSRRALKEWTPRAGDADADTLDDLPTLRERSRDANRNIPLASGALSTTVNAVVGPGLRLHPSIDAERLGMSDDEAAEWEANTAAEWRLWAESKDAEVERGQTFGELQALAFLSALENGDVFVLLPSVSRPGPYSTAVQLIEADRCENSNGQRDSERLAGGVVKGEDGAPIAYQFLTSHPGASRATREYRKVPAFGPRTGRRNVLHLYHKIRVGQTRGVPILAPVIEPLKQLGRFTDAELAAAVVASMFTVFVTSPTPELGAFAGDADIDNDAAADYKLASAAIIGLQPGESVVAPTPGRPNDAFDPFVQALWRQIGSALQIPFELLTKHFTASYSASRGAIEEMWKVTRARRKWLADGLCNPVYQTWLAEAVIKGRVAAPGFIDGDPAIRAAYCGCEWVGPPKGQINELAESQAAGERMDIGITTLAYETAQSTGGDWRRNMRQRARERTLALELQGPAQPAQPAGEGADTIDTETTLSRALTQRDHHARA